MSDVNAAVESSTPAPETHNFSPETFTPAEHKAWMDKGTIPDVTPASSTGDTKVVAPESAAGSQQEPKGKGADARKEQLNAEIRELLAKRDTLKAEVTKPAVRTESAPVKATKAAPMPEFGEKGHEEETFGQFEARKLEHVVQAALATDRAEREKERIEADTAAANKAIEDAWQESVDAAAAELKMSREEFAAAVFIKELPISKAMDEFIADAGPLGPKVLHYLATHLDEGRAIAAMSTSKADRALHLIEQALAAGTAVTPAPDKKAPVVPITKAARPAPDLKATGGAPVDELKAAVEAGDMKRFNEIQDAKLLARRRG